MTRAGDRLRDVLTLHPGWLALGCAVALSSIGITAIGIAQPGYAPTQACWLGIALGIGGLCLLPNPRQIGIVAFPVIVAVTVVLLVMILPGIPRWLVPVRNGNAAWINLGFMMWQPSELAKIAFVLAASRYLRHRDSYRTLAGLLVPFLIMFVPVGLILNEPDLGTSLLFAPALFAMLVAAGARLRHIIALVVLGVLFVTLNVVAIYTLPPQMQILKKHQRERIVAMISQVRGDTRYVKDIGYQQDKSMALFGSGGLRGYEASRAATIVRFNHLPEDHNDMVFAVVGNRWGLCGALAALGLYGVLILSLLGVAARHKDPFARLAVVGFAALLFTQMTINIGMAIGIMPIIGITLPFVSYGGSSLVASYGMVGLTLNFASQRPAIIARPSFEFDRADAAPAR